MKRISLADMAGPPTPPPLVSRLPTYSADLIAELDKMIPPRCIGADESYTSAHRYAAQRELVEALLLRLNAANPMEAPSHVPR